MSFFLIPSIQTIQTASHLAPKKKKKSHNSRRREGIDPIAFTAKFIGYKCKVLKGKNEEEKEKQRLVVELSWRKKRSGQLTCYDDDIHGGSLATA